MDARSDEEGSREAAATVAPDFRKFLREYVVVTALLFFLRHSSRGKRKSGGVKADSKTIIQSIYKMP
jgi:hypothetical protein